MHQCRLEDGRWHPDCQSLVTSLEFVVGLEGRGGQAEEEHGCRCGQHPARKNIRLWEALKSVHCSDVRFLLAVLIFVRNFEVRDFAQPVSNLQ